MYKLLALLLALSFLVGVSGVAFAQTTGNVGIGSTNPTATMTPGASGGTSTSSNPAGSTIPSGAPNTGFGAL